VEINLLTKAKKLFNQSTAGSVLFTVYDDAAVD